MLKISILEDEPAEVEVITGFLQKYQADHPDFFYTLTCYARALDLLDHYERDTDLLFLDIQLPDMKGIDVAHRIREIDSHTMIIFVTRLTQYALEGYAVSAFDYIVKPVAFDSFSAKLDRALRILKQNRSAVTLVVHTREKTVHIPSDTIYYIEVISHDLLIHTDSGTVRKWGNLSELERELQHAHFARCNSSYLINMKYIQEINGNAVTVCGKTLSISKLRRKEFLNEVARYFGGT